MVLGHSECGAIKGAIDNVQLGNLTATLSNIWPAVEATTGIPGERSSKNKAFVQAVAETNARLAARMLLERSPTMSGLVDAGCAEGGRGHARYRHRAGSAARLSRQRPAGLPDG